MNPEPHNPSPEAPGQGPVKTFLEHLEDLRLVLIRILTVLGLAWLGCFYLCPQILRFLQRPLKASGVLARYGIQSPDEFLRVFGPAAPFTISFQLALYAAVVVSMPFIIGIAGAYLLPVLTRRERRLILPIFLAGIFFFLAGTAFCYFLLLPPTLAISLDFARWMGLGASFWTVESYVSFVTKFMLGMGLGFEMPLVIMLLVRAGVLNYAMLAKARPYVIIVNFILGAVLTTPEVFTQLVMAIPLTLMYETCVWLAWFRELKKPS
ncbi:MAG: twin-arginine translocase subunit TatC [Verrucomicrobiae bacterium]|nr:twin-arginine translocase subunit TatC [Verrucomicrobiae bacterium]